MFKGETIPADSRSTSCPGSAQRPVCGLLVAVSRRAGAAIEGNHLQFQLAFSAQLALILIILIPCF